MIEANLRIALREGLPVLSVSVGIETLLGYSPEDFLAGRVKFNERIHPHDQDIADVLFAREQEKVSGTFNIRLRQANGRIRCVRAKYSKTVSTESGEVLLDLLLQDAKSLQRTMDDASAMMNFRAMMENTDDYIYFKDRNHVFTGASQTLVSLCHPAEHWTDLLGQTDYDVFPEEYADIYYRLEKQVFAGVPVANEVQETLTKDGRPGWVDNRKYPIRDAQGEVIGLYGVARDVTAVRTQAQALEESERKYRRLIENSPDIVHTYSSKRGGIYYSARAVDILGHSIEHLLAHPFLWNESIHPEDLPAVGKAMAEIRLGRPYKIEYRIRDAHGNWHWFYDRSIGSREEDGNTIVEGLAMDITERKQAEQALQEKKAQLQVIYDTASVAIFNVDVQGVITHANQRMAELFACPMQSLIGSEYVAHTHPSEREQGRRAMLALMAGKTTHVDLQRHYWREDGSEFWGHLTGRRMFDADGKTIGLVGVIADITEQKRLEEARIELEAQLRESQKMQAIGTLAGGIAHDFNNALATILGNAELARQDMGTNPLALESLEEIRKAGSRARNLVQQILSFSRRQPTERMPISLAPAVEECARLLRATLPARVTLEVHCDTDVPTALADASHIQQVLINLATNAMQAMAGRSGHIAIRLDTVMLDAALARTHPALGAMHASHPGCTLRLAVSDNGPGMNAAVLGRIFEPFFTTKPVGEGTGLGLSIVHGIVQVHEGAIVVDSQPGRGATFTLYLPEAGAPAAARLPTDSTIAAAPDTGGGQRVLYIDDDESLVFLVQRLLERRGFRISGYTNQGEALAALRADPHLFDLVVSDYNMPGMSGLDVARAVRAIRPDLPVALASGFIDEELRAQAGAAGVRELVFKADTAEGLCEALARLARTVGDKPKVS